MITPYGTWTYTYDGLNRLETITNSNNEVTTFGYDDISRRNTMTCDNGVATSFTYDAGSRLTSMITQNSQPSTLNSYTYTYDKVGNRLSMTDNDGLHVYTYDDVYQLEGATHPQAYNPDESFTYDNVGNRLTSHLSSDYVYDNLNRLQEDDDYVYTYDDNGNLITKVDKVSSDITTYQYDGENRLVKVTTPTDVIQYLYDGLGRRNVRTLNGVVTRYVYDREDILFEFDENDRIKARYTHGPGIDEPISVDRDTDGDGVLDVTYFYHYDGLGSIVAITDALGNIVQTYVYDTFGNIVQQSGNVENVYTYTGREWDAEAGLYYYRARYYDPTLGRFINGDPIGFAGGDVNFYVYVQNNPVNFIDPVGLLSWETIGSAFTVSAGIGPSLGIKTKLGPVKVGAIAGIKAEGSYNSKDGLTVKSIAEAIAFLQYKNYMAKVGPFYEKTTVKHGNPCHSVEKSGIKPGMVRRAGGEEIQASPWSVGVQVDPFIISLGVNVNLKVLWQGIWK